MICNRTQNQLDKINWLKGDTRESGCLKWLLNFSKIVPNKYFHGEIETVFVKHGLVGKIKVRHEANNNVISPLLTIVVF